MIHWAKLALAAIGLGLTMYLALSPNPLKDALLELVNALTEFISGQYGG